MCMTGDRQLNPACNKASPFGTFVCSVVRFPSLVKGV